MPRTAEEIRKERAELYRNAQEQLKIIEAEERSEAERDAATKKFDELLDRHDGMADELKRAERIEQVAAQADIREEARRRHGPSPSDVDAREALDGSRDEMDTVFEDIPTRQERQLRDLCLHRKYSMGQRLSDEHEVLCMRQWPEERAVYKYIRGGETELHEK